jgi:aminoglycoside phosphotransferase (APT) family kinase protein
MKDELRDSLQAFISDQVGQPVTINELMPLAGGASRDTWLVGVALAGDAQRLVLRRDLASSMYAQALTRAQEFALLQAAYAQDVRVPRPRWHSSDPAVLGAPFFLMDYIEGVSIGRQVVQAPELADARRALPGQMAEQLALIHAIDYQQHGLDFLPAPRPGFSPAQEAVAQLREGLDALKVENPALEFGLRWAEQHAPFCDQLTLIHGDFRVGNLIVGPSGLKAVIDWEFAHLGDPLEELAYPCMRDWRFGVGHLRLGGLAPREPFIAAYEQQSRRQVDRAAVDWWEIMGNLRWGMVCLAQTERHLSGADVSVELASLGRRSAEMQLEVLRLIEKQGL